MSQQLQRTPLHDIHANHGAKFVPFAGWEMPVQFSGLVAEHKAVRSAAGLFDVSHMGEVWVRGRDAQNFLQRLTTNDIGKMANGVAQYSLLLNEMGGVVDDIIVYQVEPECFLLCVNASNTDKDFQWLVEHQTGAVELENVSKEFAQIAIQGPRAESVVCSLFEKLRIDPELARTMKFFRFVQIDHKALHSDGIPTFLARTGYTGEDGFELFCSAEIGKSVWQMLLELNAQDVVLPIGLGARDTLRLEACLPLHGHELRDEIPANCCGVQKFIKMKKGDFIGRKALAEHKQTGLGRTLFGFEVSDRGIVREGAKIFDAAGLEIGWCSSGTFSPSLERAIGLGFVEERENHIGRDLFAEVRGKKLAIRIVERPFYRRQS